MRISTIVLGLVLVAVACAEDSVTSAETSVPPTASPSTSTLASTPTSTSPSTSTSVPSPSFSATIAAVTVAELGESWREGCPVPPEDLRTITLTHWNPAGEVVDGELVVHRDQVDDLVVVFEAIFDSGFPIASMRPASEFDGNDDHSMAADNTSAFNCRLVGGSRVWSQHSYGTAVDINPVRNPFVRGSTVDPPAGELYVDRGVDAPGLISAGDVVTSAFAAIGWGWGGNWSSSKDYQHFSANGR